ncbi:MAG: lamin tail domain-containing protein [Acidobacteria bacterium]|nr:lamin tail domain-containing protein [Acidobacteriota bacterium]
MRRHLLVPVLISAAVLAVGQLDLDAKTPSSVVISQIYGGGGNSGATLTHDFIEIFNRGTDVVSLDGWSVQYASATGSSWTRTTLSRTIEPGQYYLIQQARGTGGTVALPSPNATGTASMSATAGKVALSRSSVVLAGDSPTGSDLVDFVGFGSANAALGRPAGELSNTTAAIRRNNGCADTRNNGADFVIGVPSPRNTSSPKNPCSPLGPRITAVLNAASLLPGPIAPGTVIMILGAGLGPNEPAEAQRTPDGAAITKILADTRVVFDGVAAPIVRASSTSVVAIVPFGVAVRTETEIQVEYRNQFSTKTPVMVVEASPGIFTLDASGENQAKAWNADTTENTKDAPAGKGSIITLLVTGCRQTVPALADGQIVRGVPPSLPLLVRVLIGGIESEVTSATAMPDHPAGYARITARIPERLDYGGQIPVAIQIGDSTSQYGVTVTVAGEVPEPGTGQAIETVLTQLRSAPAEFPVAEIPDDTSPLPKERLGIVSWNIQTGGTSTASGAQRPPMVREALQRMFSGTYQVLAAQEIPNEASAEFLRSLLPGGAEAWRASFIDTPDSMNNGIWYRSGVVVRDSLALYADSEPDASGKPRSEHPPHVANLVAGDFDFTLISLHLTFADGDTRESVRELRHVLDYLDRYFSHPDHDPDAVVCGDFNISSSHSDDEAPFGVYLDRVFDGDPRFQSGERRFATTVTRGTSRRTRQNGSVPNRNLDHWVVSADALEEFVQARRVDPEVLLGHPEDPEERLTSDHFPIAAFFRLRGEGVARDNRTAIRPQ